MSDTTATLRCPHSVVQVRCTDGEQRAVSMCLVESEDIDEDGRINWPPSGSRCDAPMGEISTRVMYVE